MPFNNILFMLKITQNNANSYAKASFYQHLNSSMLMLIIHCYWYKTVTCLNFKRDVNQICFYNLIFIIHCECVQNNNIVALLFTEGKYVLRHILLYICVFVVISLLCVIEVIEAKRFVSQQRKLITRFVDLVPRIWTPIL